MRFPTNAGTVLMDRDTAGLHVELRYLPISDLTVITVWREEDGDVISRAATVPPGSALDAFRHPCAYLPDPAPFA